MKMIDRLKKDTGNSCDIIYKKMTLNKKSIDLVFSEVLSSGDYINEYIIKALIKLKINQLDFSMTNIESYL